MMKFLNKLKNSFSKNLAKPEKLKNVWGAVSITLLVILIGVINYKSGTILTGWDNLHPEFNLWLNIKRSIFAVWQEYQSLGLLGGMGHASDLVRQIALLIISPIVPMEMMRYTATIATLLIGSLGIYTLIKSYIASKLPQKEAISFLGGVFYLLNIATIQTYFVAFEAFTSHYAALPWLLYGALKFIHEKNKKSLIIFAVILLLSTPSAYIPTLYVAFLMALSIILFGQFIFASERIEFIKRSTKAFLLIFLINSFWLLPFLYFTITSANVTLEAKMNQMATDNIFLQNKEFGNVTDVMQLKGFWFNNVEPNLNRDFSFMLMPWKEYFSTPLVATASFLIFGVITAGLIYAIKNRKPILISFALLFLFTFTMLATNTPPFSWFVALFREIPLFSQAFRFPFTKFSILAALSYSVFFSLGAYALYLLIKKYARKFAYLGFLIALILIGITSFPVFRGDLFYEKEQISRPDEYHQTFEFFENQDSNTRIATLPMHTFWGWNYYKWGYGGSGFLWYGIEQPIIDRAFDVWSKTSENSYFEISNALYSKDSEALVRSLEKHQITWLLVDKNIYSPSSPKTLFHEDTQDLLSQIPSISKEESFGEIDIYKVDLENETQDFLLSKGSLPSVNSYTHNNSDAVNDFYVEENQSDIYYPLRSLFTNKEQKDIEFTASTTEDTIVFENRLPENLEGKTLNIPSLLNENFVSSEITIEEDAQGTIIVSLKILNPKITIGEYQITENNSDQYPLFIIPNASSNYSIRINGNEFDLNALRPQTIKTILSLSQNNYIYLVNNDNETSRVQIIESEFLNSLPSLEEKNIEMENEHAGKNIKIEVPKVVDSQNGFSVDLNEYNSAEDCNRFRNGSIELTEDNSDINLTSVNDSICTSYYLSSLSHGSGYFVDLEAENIEGSPFHFWILNTNQQYGVIDTDLEESLENYSYVIPALDQHGKGYSFHFDSVSIGDNKSSNTIKDLNFYPIPYAYLENIRFEGNFEPTTNSLSFSSSHPNESLYTLENISAENSSEATLMLSQSFHKGWNAYVFDNNELGFFDTALPLFFGEKIESHLKVNNWQNGWAISNPDSLEGKSVVIVFLPQYLEYLGFITLIITFIFIFSKNRLYLVKKELNKANSFFELRSEVLKSKINSAQARNSQVNFPYSIDLTDKRKYWNH